ncbi:hypothetical protein T439DRAFT_346882, partial [Meredithblackwellia eburnea MCA 4105]
LAGSLDQSRKLVRTRPSSFFPTTVCRRLSSTAIDHFQLTSSKPILRRNLPCYHLTTSLIFAYALPLVPRLLVFRSLTYFRPLLGNIFEAIPKCLCSILKRGRGAREGVSGGPGIALRLFIFSSIFLLL